MQHEHSARLRTLGFWLVLGLLATAAPAHAQPEPPWSPGEPPLSTPWTEQVGPDNALPEYPRPQLIRERWQNLNGLWDYRTENRAPEQILVPYPPESALSGIQRHDDRMVYERDVDVPAAWRGDRVLLHFGAVDQHAEVQVNGQTVAVHDGGFTSFTADITDALRPGTRQHLRVVAEDRTEAAPYPVGKQRTEPGGILYTAASGIWQTVWMEPVPRQHIAGVDITPDLASSTFSVAARTNATELTTEVVVSQPDGTEVARVSGPATEPLRAHVPDARLWSPDDPFLYDVDVRLTDRNGTTVDEVGSYAGMRSISLVEDEQGRPRMALNGRILFQHGPLDQGYWPDGIYTAPTDEALRFDLEQTKRLGFNMVRKHVKVEPARWYHWADRLGLLVWQDMPSLPMDLDIPPGEHPPPTEEAKAQLRAELADLVDQLRNVPSLVVWVPFNEGWGEFDTAETTEAVQHADPTRLVDANSGVNCCYSLPDSGAGHLYDDHTYVGPGHPEVVPPRASVNGEYGGLGLVEDGHVWPGEPQAYEMTDSRAALTRRYGEVHTDLAQFVRDSGLSASVYTQTTDVENEVNGLLTYDRALLKPDPAAVRDHNRAVIEAGTP